jgi:uncharacterized protein involved in exopolysaccharide biosynthesis
MQTGTKQQPELAPSELTEFSAPEVASQDSAESLVGRLRLLWDERWLLTKAAIAGLLMGLLIAFLLPVRYESPTKLMPPDQSSSNMAMLAALSARTGGGLGLVAGDLLGLKSSGELFVGILESQTIQSRLVNQFSLKQVYGMRQLEDARKRLGENTRILEDRRSGIITLTVSDHDPTRAAALANAYVTNLNQLVANLSTSAAHRERIFLEERLTSVKQGLEASEREFSEFASKNHAINITEQGKAMVEAAAILQGQLIAAEAELEGFRQLYTENNARVRTIKARVDEIRHQLEKIGGKGEETEPSSKGNDSLYPSLRRLPLLGVQYADLYRQMKIQEAVFESLTQQYELAKVQEAKETPSVKVLDPAEIPERKSFPPRLMILIFAVIASFVFGAVWVGVGARWAALDPDDPGKLLALEVTSSVKARIFGASQNGSGLHKFASKAWRKFGGEADASDERHGRP